MLEHKKRLWPASLIAIFSLLISVGLDYFGALDRLEYISYDWRMSQLRGDKAVPEDVAVILIDDASLAMMNPVVGRWPWPRSIYGDVVDFLSLGNPRAIVFDLLLSEDDISPAGGPDSDRRLAEASAAAGNVVFAMQLQRGLPDKPGSPPVSRPLPDHVLSMALPGAHSGVSENKVLYLPIEPVSRSAARLGVASVEADGDGVYRRAPRLYEYQGLLFPSLGVAPLLLSGDLVFPRQAGLSPSLINYYGKVDSYSMGGVIASAQKVMAGELEDLLVDPFEFEDKIVFIGASAAGLEDLKATPLSSTTPGVMIHASIAANLLSGDMLQRVPKWAVWLVAALLVFFVTLSILRLKRLVYQVMTPVIVALLSVAISWFAFRHNYVIDMVMPLVSLLLAAVSGSIYLLMTEGRDKRRVRNMLAQYVSPAVLGAVVDRYEDYLEAEVGSEERLSILFSDIRGFTSLSEAVPAARVVEMLNHYFSAMNETIFDHRGTIDKFIGDAIMAFWGAPVREPHHADLAVGAAIDMHDRLKMVNAWLAERDYPEVRIGVGINTGDVILGNIGSVQKLDYTVIGDNVNLASRLEGLTKQYGCTIMISQYTYDALASPVPCYLVDLVRVKGKQVPIRIYAPILDCDGDEAARLERWSRQGFEAYLAREWGEAIRCYEQLSECQLKHIFIDRCLAYRQAPPPAGWDGVFTMTSK